MKNYAIALAIAPIQLPVLCCVCLSANFFNQDMNLVRASASDRSGKPAKGRWCGARTWNE
ncbi:MAG: hypothetical protein ACKVOQ_04435 [Cyclobacteriaceae bacterium]